MNDKLIQIGRKSYQKCQVVILPTEKASLISKGLAIPNLFFCPNTKRYSEEGEQYQHLYILSDEEIKFLP